METTTTQQDFIPYPPTVLSAQSSIRPTRMPRLKHSFRQVSIDKTSTFCTAKPVLIAWIRQAQSTVS